MTTHISKNQTPTKRECRYKNQRREWEKNHNKIIESIFTHGGTAKTHKIIEDTGLPRQTIRKHLVELENKNKIKYVGKGLYEILNKCYMRNSPKDYKTELTNIINSSRNIRIQGETEFSHITSFNGSKTIISNEDNRKIVDIISKALNRNGSNINQKVFISYVINTKPKELDYDVLMGFF